MWIQITTTGTSVILDSHAMPGVEATKFETQILDSMEEAKHDARRRAEVFMNQGFTTKTVVVEG